MPDSDYSQLEGYLREMKKTFSDTRQTILEPEWGAARDLFLCKFDSSYLNSFSKTEGTKWRSRFMSGLVRNKVRAANAQFKSVYFQGGKLPFTISPTPEAEVFPGMGRLPGEVAQARAEKMQSRIEDDYAQLKAIREYGKAIFDGCLYNFFVMKFRVMPVTYFKYNFQSAGMGDLLQYGRHVQMKQTVMIPTHISLSPWNVLWDYEADDPQQGKGIIHVEKFSGGELLKWAKRQDMGYLPEAIRQVVQASGDTGTASTSTTSADDVTEHPKYSDITDRFKKIEVCEFHCSVPRRYLENSGGDIYGFEDTSDQGEIEIVVTTGNGRVIRSPYLNENPNNHRTIEIGQYNHTAHEIIADGVAISSRPTAELINGLVRMIIDNKRLAGSVNIAAKMSKFQKGTSFELFPGCWFPLSEEVQSVDEAIKQIIVQDVSDNLWDMVNRGEQWLDEDSSVPKFESGVTAHYTPKTAYQTRVLQEAANKVIGEAIRSCDDWILEPAVTTMYHHYMRASQDENIKGDYVPDAHGFSTYDKLTKGQTTLNLLQFALSNELLANITKVPQLYREIFKSNDLDPDQFLMQDAEIAREQQMQQAFQQQQQQIQQLQGQLQQELQNGQMTKQQLLQATNALQQMMAQRDAAIQQGMVIPGVNG